MIKGKNEIHIHMEVRSENSQPDRPADAELHIVYRNVDYKRLLRIEQHFIAKPLQGLIDEARKME